MERLDKILVSQNIGSRKEAAKLIRGRLVTVDGETVTAPDFKLNPEESVITVQGQPLNFREHLYIMLNKPAGVVSATEDRISKTVLELLPAELRRKGLFPAGRLDKDTEGLLLITDDGKWAHRILSPRAHIYKRYLAELDAELSEQGVKRLADGITLKDGTQFLPASVEKISPKKIYIEICEGKFHQVKRMLSAVGCEVIFLKRVRIGGLALDEDLEAGNCRELTEAEKNAVFLGK